MALAEVLLAQFEDREHGGFFHQPRPRKLIHRDKPGHDNATPSGNGVAAFALQRLGHLLARPVTWRRRSAPLKLFYPAMVHQPSSFATLATALEEALAPPQIVMLRGPSAESKRWQDAAESPLSSQHTDF